MSNLTHSVVVCAASVAFVSSALAIGPVVETFNAGDANWYNSGFTNSRVNWFPNGSADGSGYAGVSREPRFYDSFGLMPLFEGRRDRFSSGNVMFGNWLADPVLSVQVKVRWRSFSLFFSSVQFYARFSNGTGTAIATATTPVGASQWQTLTFDVRPTAPLQIQQPYSYGFIFGDVSAIDFGVVMSSALQDTTGVFDFSIDDITMNVPCPADLDNGSGSGTPDGGVTIDDLLYYLNIYALGLARADLDDGSATGTRDGGVTIDDLLYFLVRYESGC